MRKIALKFLAKLPTHYVTSGIVLILVLFIYGVVGSYFIMGFNLIDSIYYSVTTMATVGYGDITPHTGIQKMFATTLAIGGVALLAYVFNIILTNFQEKMSRYSKGVRKMKIMNEMKDYYILCGYGRVGKVVFNELRQRNQNVIVIDKDEDRCNEIEENDSVVVINREATEGELIAKLAGEKCQSVIISTGDDVSNLFIVLTIRETNPDAWIVTRSSRIENISKLRKAGANKVVSPEVIGGKDIYFESAKPNSLRITVRHTPDELYDEFETIIKHGCTLENIDYHLPGIETPLNREIKTINLEDGQKYWAYLQNNKEQKEALINLYKSVSNIHSHVIAGPDKTVFENLIKDLEQQEEILGIDLTDKEIAALTRERCLKGN